MTSERLEIGPVRLSFIRSASGVARLLQAAARVLAYAGAAAMRRRELDDAVRREWDAYGRNPWASRAPLNEWEREFFFRFLRPGDRVLFVGCGAGRDIIPLIEAGHEVTGLDLSAESIEACRRNLQERGLTASLHVGSIENASLPAGFDAVVFSWFCYSYIPQTRARTRVLQSLPRLLRPESRILLSYIRRNLGISRIPSGIAGLVSRLSRSDWRPELGDYLELWRGSRDLSVHFEHRFLPEEVLAEARAAGLRVLDHHETADDGRIVLLP